VVEDAKLSHAHELPTCRIVPDDARDQSGFSLPIYVRAERSVPRSGVKDRERHLFVNQQKSTGARSLFVPRKLFVVFARL
jgi:hypothetical protein